MSDLLDCRGSETFPVFLLYKHCYSWIPWETKSPFNSHVLLTSDSKATLSFPLFWLFVSLSFSSILFAARVNSNSVRAAASVFFLKDTCPVLFPSHPPSSCLSLSRPFSFLLFSVSFQDMENNHQMCDNFQYFLSFFLSFFDENTHQWLESLFS